MSEANVLDSITHQPMVAIFLGPRMLTVQCYKSNSPEGRDFIRLEVGPSLVCLAIGKIYGRSSVPPNLYVIFAR
jgi:hypothetical protein